MNEPLTEPYRTNPQITPKTTSAVSLDSTSADTSTTGQGAGPPPGLPRGRFMIVKEHARGGLGMVSVAVDARLKRQVALKEILPERRNIDGLRERFVTEAEVTALLEHPGIVPIYALDDDDTGHPYYAMRFVQGRTLGEAIRAYHRQPSPLGLRELLRALRQHLPDDRLCP